ncbi:MAG TPA: hypothetical protein VFU23_11285 [Gemmatimonadales bacterium]|nr:hypothetical protein [Gemmatimonadales bacterium]
MQTMTHSRIATALIALMVGTGCTAGRTAISGPVPEPGASLRPAGAVQANLLPQEEIRSVESGASALEAVRRLRPEFLNRHVAPYPGDADEGYAMVYLDGIPLGGIETLQNIPVSTILEIRYLRAGAAAELYGKHHRGGVLAVRTFR